jgi:hypothetical protein
VVITLDLDKYKASYDDIGASNDFQTLNGRKLAISPAGAEVFHHDPERVFIYHIDYLGGMGLNTLYVKVLLELGRTLYTR